jgi:hypothetical protein
MDRLTIGHRTARGDQLDAQQESIRLGQFLA